MIKNTQKLIICTDKRKWNDENNYYGRVWGYGDRDGWFYWWLASLKFVSMQI